MDNFSWLSAGRFFIIYGFTPHAFPFTHFNISMFDRRSSIVLPCCLIVSWVILHIYLSLENIRFALAVTMCNTNYSGLYIPRGNISTWYIIFDKIKIAQKTFIIINISSLETFKNLEIIRYTDNSR